MFGIFTPVGGHNLFKLIEYLHTCESEDVSITEQGMVLTLQDRQSSQEDKHLSQNSLSVSSSQAVHARLPEPSSSTTVLGAFGARRPTETSVTE